MVHKVSDSKEAREKELSERMANNTYTDEGIERNDKIIESLEDTFHIELTGLYGEDDPKRIKKAIKWLSSGAKGNNQFLSEAE